MTTTFRTHDGRTLQQAASDLVAREVHLCLSSMVSTLAGGAHTVPHRDRSDTALFDLTQQAFELAAPVLDYEAAAREAGWQTQEDGQIWKHYGLGPGPLNGPQRTWADSWEDACARDGIDPRDDNHELEVYEHWAVSTWLAEKLQAAGERVDTDFAGLNVWARTTTGQAISIDGVIERITREMHAA